MAQLMCIACAAFAWCSSWLLLGGRLAGRVAWHARCKALTHAGRRLLVVLSGTSVAKALLSLQWFDELASLVESRTTDWRRPLSHSEGGAATMAIGWLCMLVGGWASQSPVGAFVLVLALLGCVRMRQSQVRRQQAHDLAREMPGVLRAMATALSSGRTLVQAMEYVGLHEHGPAAEPFARAGLRLRCGMSVDEALGVLRAELVAPGVDLMVTALSISQRTGSPLRELLQRTARLVEQQGEFERMLSVRTAQVRLSVRIVCGMPLLMVCLLALISVDYQKGLVSVPGMVSIVLAACMDAVALLLIRRILGGVLQ